MNAIDLSKNIIAYAAMNECQVTNLKLQRPYTMYRDIICIALESRFLTMKL